ncbi:MAG: peptidylprolyl isomerase [Bacilli bacterium]|jgi:peptidyl-prolyl cis-trans isomerase B (cyclophilin B)|nr:peptidylprolyl isomerase [Bacilli bacterium]MDD2681617.1 peptidylprolyl isomerase [Bacilli bacterium]MDD3120816.1 peptidylprolyl isomerase [Bacilli bacterium]MDD4063011.1 peptidylprolyl isomerase [Bacilli bacterium]MDD4481709.1 peptidylprolyl isomerase [Bacilli bacterium]
MIKIILENNKEIDIELMEQYAPNTVNNFLNLVRQKYFDNLIFHRIISNFMVQGGGYYFENGKVRLKKPIPSIRGEFLSNGFNNHLKHTPGVISMARTNDKNSASNQFFICTAQCPHLDGNYAAFGKVINQDSMDVLMELDCVKTITYEEGLQDFPYPIIRIKTIKEV